MRAVSRRAARACKRTVREEGAAAIEFALVAIPLSMMLFGMTEFGLFFLQAQSLKSAAREGARVAAVGGTHADVRAGLLSGSGGALPGSYACFDVRVPSDWRTFSPPTSCTGPPEPATRRYCDPASSTYGQLVFVTIPTGSTNPPVTYSQAGLPSNVQEGFQINVPFVPLPSPHPTITASFRCEE